MRTAPFFLAECLTVESGSGIPRLEVLRVPHRVANEFGRPYGVQGVEGSEMVQRRSVQSIL